MKNNKDLNQQKKDIKKQLNDGKSVKASDLMSSLGIEVHHM